MAERPVEELLRKHLGISVPRMVLGIIMLIFGIVILVWPELLGILVALYLIVSGVLVIVEEYMKSKLAAASR